MTDKSKLNPESTELDEIIAEFICAEEAGEPVNHDSLLAKHPEYSGQLNQFFADRNQFRRLASPLSPAATRRNDLPVTVRYFGDYELLEEISQGGMGVVYKARQKSLNRIVAVKMVLAGQLASDQDIKRFEGEAKTAATLKHRAIVPIHEVGHQHGQHYFSMDLIEGHNLAEVIRTDPPTPDQAAQIINDVAEAVDYAHQEGIVHRDLKPSNILIDRSGEVHITDFGLALHVEEESGLTQTGQILGTPAYMPPEQARGKRDLVGPASDIYAIGAILYELLTGRPPFRGESAADTIRQLLDTDPLSPRQLSPSTPRDLETICLTCLEKEPHRRYGTAAQLAEDLKRYLSGNVISARPIGYVQRSWRWCRRNPAVAGLAFAFTVSMIIGTSLSGFLAFEATRRAGNEQEAKEEALAQKALATTEKEKVIQLLGDLDSAEVALNRQRKELIVGQEKVNVFEEAISRSQERLALAELRLNRKNRARSYLDQIPEGKESFVGRFLTAWCDRKLLSQSLAGLIPDDVSAGLYSERNRSFYFVQPNHLSVLKLTAGSHPQTLASGEKILPCLQITEDGRYLAFAHPHPEQYGTVISVFNCVTEKSQSLEDRIGGELTKLTFSPDGKFLAAASSDEVMVWHVPSFELNSKLPIAGAQDIALGQGLQTEATLRIINAEGTKQEVYALERLTSSLEDSLAIAFPASTVKTTVSADGRWTARVTKKVKERGQRPSRRDRFPRVSRSPPQNVSTDRSARRQWSLPVNLLRRRARRVGACRSAVPRCAVLPLATP